MTTQLAIDDSRSAVFSDDRAYRYSLSRIWDEDKQPALVIGMNPSTADENTDDPTIRRCIRFARDWGYGGLLMGNLYAYRSTDPKKLKVVHNPVGEYNNSELCCLHDKAGITIAAWGAIEQPDSTRPKYIRELLGQLHVLGLTKDGYPRHPLYVKADTKPVAWA